jgi:predicted nucleotidyltransferase
MQSTIQQHLSQIEQQHDVTILFACESGSRAWGFPSPDSDYDVRFIYSQKPASYIRVFDKRDVIEEPINGLLDINGWDIKKALGLLRKCNPALMEWLSSPIIYRQHDAGILPLKTLTQSAFLPLSSYHHYLSMAKQDVNKLVESRDIRLKKYLYMFRALMAAQWVIEKGTQPPMRFQDLLNTFLPSGSIRDQVDDLLELKSQSLESEFIPAQEDLDGYLLRLYGRLEAKIPAPISAMPCEHFDQCLRETLSAVWPELQLAV